MKQVKQIILTGILLFCITPTFSQIKKHLKGKVSQSSNKAQTVAIGPQLKRFLATAASANVTFTFPAGFKEIPAPDNEDVSFDYAMELPGKEFEIWFEVRSQKENYAAYQRSKNNRETNLANPDSMYLDVGKAYALAFTGSSSGYFSRTIPPRYLKKYNADAGRSYLLNLLNNPVTKHYKYALLVTLQRDHLGTIMAVCFANEKGPEFFKNMNSASTCIQFKP